MRALSAGIILIGLAGTGAVQGGAEYYLLPSKGDRITKIAGGKWMVNLDVAARRVYETALEEREIVIRARTFARGRLWSTRVAAGSGRLHTTHTLPELLVLHTLDPTNPPHGHLIGLNARTGAQVYRVPLASKVVLRHRQGLFVATQAGRLSRLDLQRARRPGASASQRVRTPCLRDWPSARAGRSSSTRPRARPAGTCAWAPRPRSWPAETCST